MTDRSDYEPINLIQFHATSDGDRDFERELISVFLEDTGRRCELLNAALSKGKDEEARYEAHTVKGACANVGAEEMHRLAERIERSTRKGEVAAALADCRKLFAEFQRVKLFLERYLADR